MLRNAGLRFVCRDVWLRVESKRTPFTLAINRGDVLRMPIAHGDGNWTADPRAFAEMKARDQVVFRYVSADGTQGGAANSMSATQNGRMSGKSGPFWGLSHLSEYVPLRSMIVLKSMVYPRCLTLCQKILYQVYS